MWNSTHQVFLLLLPLFNFVFFFLYNYNYFFLTLSLELNGKCRNELRMLFFYGSLQRHLLLQNSLFSQDL